ncbi:MAG TPA: CDP-alcohol phosphatidyltransferase family protein, partial [Chthoniobacterales bacterium]|nr:CDP-alcohol phosphatidyltransferase family protein [Chthoniobacterales bacterium]
SQDGLVSRYVNRPISRTLTRWLLKTNIVPSTWSVLIFALPLAACAAFLRGTGVWFIVGCATFQLYSILDGCDGEIARAKFLQTEFGRRLDSLLDLTGNMLLALCLGIGLGLHALPSLSLSWFYIAEGAAAALCVVLSEGIVFLRRSRIDQQRGTAPLNGALYHRHQEFFQRSGILVFGENVAWWMVFLTKRDMAMLAFVVLAIVGYPEWILHLLLGVGAINSALAGNAFLRAPAPALQQEAS